MGADGKSYRYDPLIRLGEEERKAVEKEIMLAAREAEAAAAAAAVRSQMLAGAGVM